MTDTTRRKRGTWPPGVSGNPSGLPKRPSNDALMSPVDVALQRLLRRDARVLVNTLLTAAKAGDAAAAGALLVALGQAAERARP